MLESDSVNMVDDSMVEYESADKGMDIPIAFLEAYPYPAAVFSRRCSVPGAPYQAPEPIWWNDAWAQITAEQRLADCVNDGALAVFAEWLDAAEPGAGFELCIEADGYPQFPLQLAQTPLPNATVVTSITTSMPPPVAADYIPTPPLPSRKAARHLLEDFSEFGPNLNHRSSRKSSAAALNNNRRRSSSGMMRHSNLPKPTPATSSPAAAAQPQQGQGQGQGTTDPLNNSESESSTTLTYPQVARTGLPPAEDPADGTTQATANGNAATKPRADGKRHHHHRNNSNVQQEGTEKKPEMPRPKQHAPEDNFKRQELDIAMAGVAAEYDRLVETTEWDKTRLGPYSQWSSALKSMMGICFASATQDSIWFRPLDSDDIDDTHIVYNANYATLLDHPKTFGRPATEVWDVLWPMLKPLAEKCYNGDCVYHQNDLLLYEKNERGRLREKYHTWSYVPIRDVDLGNRIVGLYNMSLDTTDKVIAERRFDTARELVEEIAFAQNRRKLFETLADVLERNPMDVPFALCYSISDERQVYNSVDLTLEAAVGVPDGHPSCPNKMQVPLPARRRPMAAPMQAPDLQADFHTAGSPSPTTSSRRMSSRSVTSSGGTMRGHSYIVSEDKTSWPIAQALQLRQCVVMDDCSELVKGLPLRQWDILPDQAIVIPVMNNHTSPSAVLILGLNVQSTLDQAYLDWIHVLRGHLASAIASVTAFEEQVLQRLEREKLERAKTAWFRGAAHEFRTPLTLIAGPLEDVLTTHLDGEQRNTIKLAQRNVQRLQRLVTTLLDFTRIEAGRLTAHFAPGDFGQFVENIASLFKPALDRKGIEFILDIEDSSALVSFDPVLFEMVLSNVLSNSFKYTTTGSVTLKVWIDDNVNFSIVDTGIGVGDDENVGQMYHRTQTAVSSGVGGRGIGLALAKEIVKLHEGELTIAQNADGVGTHVFIWFPKDHLETEDYFLVAPFGAYVRQTANEMVLSTIGEEVGSEWSGDTRRDSIGSIGTPRTIASSQSISGTSSVAAQALGEALMFEKSDILLVVDDNEELRTYISHIFSSFCTVIQASGGDEAYKLVKSHRPHLVLSDLLMPQSSGMDLLLAIRSSEDRGIKSTPVIILSAINDDETRLEALVNGAEEYISKPFKRNELLARVHLHMQMGKRRAALEDLFAQREQEIAVLSDHCPSGIIRADADGRIVYANAAFCEPAGITAADITRDTDLLALWAKCCDEDTIRLMADKWAAIFDGEAATTNVTWKWKTGRTMSANFIRLDQVRPNMSGIIGCVTDISYQEERLQEAEQRRIAAEEQKRQHERLVDFTSHEIRTPVSAILQCSSIVKENLLTLQEQLTEDGSVRASPALLAQVTEDLAALDSIHQCGLVQERIAADVLSLARIQLDMLSLHSVPVDIVDAGQSALNLFKAEAKMKKIRMQLEYGETMRITGVRAVNTDPVRLGQVITNLISNAIRFTSNSTVREITVAFNVAWAPPTVNCVLPPEAVFPRDDAVDGMPVYLYVAVRDTGPGMTPEERDGLFQRFHQGNKVIHTQYGGSGLGLFICKNITELLGGRIEVESAVGKGSEFRFFIQTETATMPPPKTSDAELEERRSQRTKKVQKMNVLVVEDNEINSTVLRRQILKAGLDCDVADNGLVALNRLLAVRDLPPLTPSSESSLTLDTTPTTPPRQPYDVVLMDLEMPVMDGLTAVRRIRQLEAERKLPGHQLVIALTGNAREGQIEEALKSGMDDVVIKPYKLPKLLRTMEQAVTGQSLGDLRLN